jgi:hypothetical protein
MLRLRWDWRACGFSFFRRRRRKELSSPSPSKVAWLLSSLSLYGGAGACAYTVPILGSLKIAKMGARSRIHACQCTWPNSSLEEYNSSMGFKVG